MWCWQNQDPDAAEANAGVSRSSIQKHTCVHQPCYCKWAPQASKISLSRELVRCWVTPHLPSQNLHFWQDLETFPGHRRAGGAVLHPYHKTSFWLGVHVSRAAAEAGLLGHTWASQHLQHLTADLTHTQQGRHVYDKFPWDSPRVIVLKGKVKWERERELWERALGTGKEAVGKNNSPERSKASETWGSAAGGTGSLFVWLEFQGLCIQDLVFERFRTFIHSSVHSSNHHLFLPNSSIATECLFIICWSMSCF